MSNTDLKQQIAADLERVFSEQGFAEPSVSQIKDACHVSLRTLYKHYPSKEQMIIAALDHRHGRYINYLTEGIVHPGEEAVRILFDNLGHWMQEFAPNGCLSMNALAAFPENDDIRQGVALYKHDVSRILGERSGRKDLALELFLLHESASATWSLLGRKGLQKAQKIALSLLDQ